MHCRHVFAAALVTLLTPAGASVLRVQSTAAGAGDGSSWVDAFPHLQDALAAAAPGDEIRVAAGVYYPDDGAGLTAGDIDVSFALPPNVTISGGYPPFGGPRDPSQHLTVLWFMPNTGTAI